MRAALAFCFCMVLAILITSSVVISINDSKGVILAKMSVVRSEISADNKKRGG